MTSNSGSESTSERVLERRQLGRTGIEVTTLGHKGPGDPVNLEVDVIAKYVERLLSWKDV